MSRSRWCSFHPTGKPCWVLVYSALLCWLFSGAALKEMVASLTWPTTLPPGGLLNGMRLLPSDIMTASHDITTYRVVISVVFELWTLFLRLCKNSVCNRYSICNKSTSIGPIDYLWMCCNLWNSPLSEYARLVSIEVRNRGCIGLDPTDYHFIPI